MDLSQFNNVENQQIKDFLKPESSKTLTEGAIFDGKGVVDTSSIQDQEAIKRALTSDVLTKDDTISRDCFPKMDLPPRGIHPNLNDWEMQKLSLAPQESPDKINEGRLVEYSDAYNKEVKDKSAAGTVQESDVKDWRKVTPEEYQEVKKDFMTNKEDYIKQWEEKNGCKWPRYDEVVYSNNGKLIHRRGDRYDAHHIQPVEFGGKNNPENIAPMHANDHFDKQGIHRPDGPYSKIAEALRNQEG